MTEAIRFERVSYRYPRVGDVLQDVTFTVGQGEMAFLTGPSGAGKSTLLKLVGLLLRPSQGTVFVNGENLRTLGKRKIPAHRRQIGIIFQNSTLLEDRSVFDNVAIPLLIRGYAGADIGRRVRAALDAVGLLGREKALPRTLSGGEQQRVGIARAVVARPTLLLADEPTGNLDPVIAREVMHLFARFNEVGTSVLIATHAISLIRNLPNRVLYLDRGRLGVDTPPPEIVAPPP